MPKYPSIPEPTLKAESLRDSVLSIKQVIESITGQTGNRANHAVTMDSNLSTSFPDYRVFKWVPVLTFVTPGNLAVVYAAQMGYATRIGQHMFVDFTITTSTFTHSTASGQLNITGLPFPAGINDAFYRTSGALTFQGITKASYTSMVVGTTGGSSNLRVFASGSAVSTVAITTADMPTGGVVSLVGSISYVTDQ